MRIEGLCEIASQFDAMLIDQFGVIHDGQKLYPGALEVLKRLKDLDIPVVIMTNSGKRAKASIDRTVKLGLPRELFLDCVSSGEVAYKSIDVTRAYLIGKRGDDYLFDPIIFVDDPHNADVMLILGSNAPETSLSDYEEMFRSLTIPAICCNPDKLMFSPKGFQTAPGAIAQMYEAMGGKVTWVGKPYSAIYTHALDLLGSPARVLCIGDSPEHDIAGGRAAELTTLLVQQGVCEMMSEMEIDPTPDYIMRSFQWA
jgi:HAD superfamily hydrolase (TIGR01459 family)